MYVCVCMYSTFVLIALNQRDDFRMYNMEVGHSLLSLIRLNNCNEILVHTPSWRPKRIRRYYTRPTKSVEVIMHKGRQRTTVSDLLCS